MNYSYCEQSALCACHSSVGPTVSGFKSAIKCKENSSGELVRRCVPPKPSYDQEVGLGSPYVPGKQTCLGLTLSG